MSHLMSIAPTSLLSLPARALLGQANLCPGFLRHCFWTAAAQLASSSSPCRLAIVSPACLLWPSECAKRRRSAERSQGDSTCCCAGWKGKQAGGVQKYRGKEASVMILNAPAQVCMGSVSLLFCLVFCGVMSTASSAYPVKEVQSCLEDALRDRRFMRKTNKTLHLDYGDPAIEVFNILSAHNTMSIRALEQCVRNLMPEMFQDRSSVATRNYTHGGSNITYLTGIFQAALPEISNKLVDCTVEPMRESQHYWMAPVRTLGIRAVYLESFSNVRPRLSKEERRKLRYAKYLEEKNRTVWLGKPGPDVPFVEDEDEEEEEEYEYDEHADENLAPYLDRDIDSLYKIVVLLSDRSHFSGGEIYVARQKRGDDRGDGRGAGDGREGEEGEGEGEDAYEEEDEDVGQVADETIQGVLTRKKRVSFPKYNARTAKIARYTPEKGGVLLLRTDYDHGMGTLQRGKRHALVLEFWPYADAAPGATRPTLKEAQPLPQRWREL